MTDPNFKDQKFRDKISYLNNELKRLVMALAQLKIDVAAARKEWEENIQTKGAPEMNRLIDECIKTKALSEPNGSEQKPVSFEEYAAGECKVMGNYSDRQAWIAENRATLQMRYDAYRKAFYTKNDPGDLKW